MNNTNKHDIEEMAKGQIGLKWPPSYELKLHRYKSNKHKTN